MYKLAIVDDEDAIRNGLASIVPWSELGFEVVDTFEDGRDIIEYLKFRDVDIILTDIMMSHLHGLDVARWVHENRPDIQVVVLSGYSDFLFAQKAIKYGVKQYLLKPTKINELKESFTNIRTQLDAKESNVSQLAVFHKLYRNHILDRLFSEPDNQTIIEDIFSYLGCKGKVSAYRYIVAVIGIEDMHAHQDADIYMKGLIKAYRSEPDHFVISTHFDDKIISLILSPIRMSKTSAKAAAERVLGEVSVQLVNLFGVQYHIENILVFDNYTAISNEGIQNTLFEANKQLFNNSDKNDIETYNKMNALSNAFKDKNIGEIREILVYDEVDMNASEQFRRMSFSLIIMIRGYYQKKNIVPESLLDATIYRKIMCSHIVEIKDYVYDMLDQLESDMHASALSVLDDIINYVPAHLEQKITLADIADEVHLHPAYISRLFKEKTGENFSDYVIRMRIEKAMELLSRRECKVYEIADMLGYKDIQHFYKTFRKITGVSPSTYRKAIHRKVYTQEG